MDDFETQVDMSNGFFQELVTNTLQPGVQPVLQVIEMRTVQAANIIRMRLSDGVFTYSNCVASLSIEDRLQMDGLMDCHGIIKITEFVRSFVGGKAGLSIANYKLLQLTNTILGDPKPHSGNPDDYKGIENFPAIMNPNANNAQVNASPSRKRGLNDAPVVAPNKRQNTMPSGGLFSDGIMEISMVTPYVNKFRICGVASFKEEPRTITTKRGPSSVFSFVLTDANGNAIKISAFGKECEKFSDLVQNELPFYVTCNGTNLVREANRRYNSTGHTYEITLNGQCEIDPCTDRVIQAPTCKLTCIPLIDVKNHANNCVDILAVVDKVGELTSVTVKSTGKALDKRDVTLIDNSCTQVQLTLWANEVNKLTPENVGDAIGIKGALVREYNGGFSLSTGSSSAILAAPDGMATQKLLQWYREERPSANVGSLSVGGGTFNFERECRAIQPIVDTDLSVFNKGMYVTVEAFITSVKSENVAYPACTKGECRKKVTEESNQWNCPACGPQDTHRWLYMLSVEIADFSGSAWLTLFDDVTAVLFNMKADDLMDLMQNDRAAYDRTLQSIRFKQFEFRMRVSNETYNDQQRVRWHCMTIRSVNHDNYVKALKRSLEALPVV